MLKASDLIQLPYTPDLSEGGSAYACRWLAATNERMGASPGGRLRGIAGGAVVELAFRRYLTGQAVPFKVREGTPFSQPEHYNLALGGHRCDIINYLLTRPSQLVQLRQDPASLLQAPALIPIEQFAAPGHKPDDLYVFAFLAGSVAAALRDVKTAISAGQTVHLVHPLPEEWRLPPTWRQLESLSLKSECEEALPVEIGGLDAQRNFVTEAFELPPLKRTAAPQEFFSLAYMHAGRLPDARLGLHSPVIGEPYLIQPHEWSNIWITGEQILLAGWLTHEEFHNKAAVLNAGMPTFQFTATRTKNLSVQMDLLKPLGGLLEKVRRWELEKINARM